MKISKNTPIALIIVSSIWIVAGCASSPTSSESGKEIAVSGPTILNPRTDPSTIELNRDLMPVKTAEVLTDVKDFKGNVTDVRLQFTHVPLEVPMENIGGTTWRAQLSPKQLQMLAVSGRTIRYDANIIAKNDRGQTAISSQPVEVAIKAPDLSSGSTG